LDTTLLEWFQYNTEHMFVSMPAAGSVLEARLVDLENLKNPGISSCLLAIPQTR